LSIQSIIPHNVIKSTELRNEVLSKGYAIIDFLSPEQVNQLRNFYFSNHNLGADSGAMHNSILSNSPDYKRFIHQYINSVIENELDKYFVDYKTIANSFLVKTPGPDSGFFVHQDMSMLDETKFSPLSLWIPLQNITSDNSPFQLIKGSHIFSLPYRCKNLPFYFSSVEDIIKDYLSPILIKAGQCIVFDQRIIHYSGINADTAPRVAIGAAIFPLLAELQISSWNSVDKQICIRRVPDTFFIDNCIKKMDESLERFEISQTIHFEPSQMSVSDLEALKAVTIMTNSK
jgi:hypothetical protein